MIPAIIGGAIAAGSIASNMYDNYQRDQRTREAYDDIKDAIAATNRANEQDIADYMARVQSTYGTGANSYQQALADFLNSPVYQNKDFGYTRTLDEFYDPYVNQQMAAAQDALNNSAASGHNRFSSAYNEAAQAKAKAMSSEAWRDAYDMMMKDRQQAMSEYSTNSQNQWNNYNATADRAKYGIDAYGNDRNALMQGIADATMAGMNNRTGVLQSQVNATTGVTNALNSQAGTASQILGPASQFMGSYFGGK